MKTYRVCCIQHVTQSCCIEVQAENEEDANRQVYDMRTFDFDTRFNWQDGGDEAWGFDIYETLEAEEQTL